MAEEIKVQRKKRGLSLIQPTSVPTLGNYLGAMRGWVDFQEDFDTIFGIADLHSITVRQDPKRLREQTVQLYASFCHFRTFFLDFKPPQMRYRCSCFH